MYITVKGARRFFICPKNLDHIMPYRLPYVFFSDQAKIFFGGLISLPTDYLNTRTVKTETREN